MFIHAEVVGWKECKWSIHQGHQRPVPRADAEVQLPAEDREVHQRALEAAHLLEQNIERLSWAASKAKSARCLHTYGHSCSRMQSQGRCHQSPGPTRPRRHVTFWNQEEEMSSEEGPLMEPLGQVPGGGEVEESDLGPLPTLELELEQFLEAPTPMWVPEIGKAHPRALNKELWVVARMAGLPGWYAWLVEGVGHYTQCRWSWDASSQNLCLLWSSPGKVQGP